MRLHPPFALIGPAVKFRRDAVYRIPLGPKRVRRAAPAQRNLRPSSSGAAFTHFRRAFLSPPYPVLFRFTTPSPRGILVADVEIDTGIHAASFAVDPVSKVRRGDDAS